MPPFVHKNSRSEKEDNCRTYINPAPNVIHAFLAARGERERIEVKVSTTERIVDENHEGCGDRVEIEIIVRIPFFFEVSLWSIFVVGNSWSAVCVDLRRKINVRGTCEYCARTHDAGAKEAGTLGAPIWER